MSLIRALTGGALGGYADQEIATAKSPYPVKQRTLREEIGDQIKFHEARIQKLNDALNSLTPDVEKALNALQQLSN